MSRKEREEEELPAVKRLKTEFTTTSDANDDALESGCGDHLDRDDQMQQGSNGKEASIKMEAEGSADTTEDQERKREDKGYSMLSQVKEEDVGITEYISDHKGISAIIKQRYSDFIVNEISSTGEVVHLTTTDIPVVIEESEPDGPVDSVLPEEFLSQLKQVAAGSVPGLTASLPVGDDKEKRLHIHRAVKAAFPNLDTKTEEKDGGKVITAMLRGAGKDNRRNRAFEWPKSKSDCHICRFVLYKENKGTMDAIHLIARYLKIKDSVFHYAGTKDRRGKTTQEVTAFKVHPKKLQDLNKFLHNIILGNFRYVDKPLRLGVISGNRFTVVLRNVIGSDDDIEAGLNSLKSVGFINYYGLQRFGTLSVCTHKVGKALLAENWEQAVDLIIAGSGSEPQQVFRKVWQKTKDPLKTLERVENKHYFEKLVLRALARRPKDFFSALQTLPRNTRLIYPHSYQSFVWNKVVSQRIKTFGLEPLVGDLVLPPDAAAITELSDMDITAEGENIEQEDEAEAKEQADKEEESKEGKGHRPATVKPLVLDQTNLSQYSIYDVVYPLPGFDIVYPQNETQNWYKAILEKDGFDVDKMQRKHKDYSLPGGYRAMVVRPKDIEWANFWYNDTTQPLALSDADILNEVKEPQSIPDGKMKAIRLSFALTPSSYATMALREVLKADTSPSQQAALNVT